MCDNGEKTTGNNGEKTWTGYGNTQCTFKDIYKAGSASANLNDSQTFETSVINIINGADKNIKWECAPEHIKGSNQK